MRVSPPWSPADIGDLSSKIALVTGANSGLGYWTALHLARHGAHVVMACRSAPRAEAALADLTEAVPDGSFEILTLDLADISSVRSAAAAFTRTHPRLDVLCNNAGVAMRSASTTADGFELHLGANFLGHFALTALLAPALLATPGSRVVHVSSLQHRVGRVRFEDLQFARRRYTPWAAYGQSKVANLLFMAELERRLRRTGTDAISVGCHPGVSGTAIFEEMPIVGSPLLRPLATRFVGLFPSPEEAAHPTLYAATAPDVGGGTYTGPGGRLEIRGAPNPAYLAKAARDVADAERLWSIAEHLTGTRFALGD